MNSKVPPIIWVWTGESMMPTAHFELLCRHHFVTGQAYRGPMTPESKPQRRSNDQNAKMWAMLNEIADQVEHNGSHYNPDQWKAILMHGWRQEISFLPSIDGKTFVPYAGRSSILTIAEMAEFLEYIQWFAAARNVKLRNEEELTWK